MFEFLNEITVSAGKISGSAAVLFLSLILLLGTRQFKRIKNAFIALSTLILGANLTFMCFLTGIFLWHDVDMMNLLANGQLVNSWEKEGLKLSFDNGNRLQVRSIELCEKSREKEVVSQNGMVKIESETYLSPCNTNLVALVDCKDNSLKVCIKKIEENVPNLLAQKNSGKVKQFVFNK